MLTLGQERCRQQTFQFSVELFRVVIERKAIDVLELHTFRRPRHNFVRPVSVKAATIELTAECVGSAEPEELNGRPPTVKLTDWDGELTESLGIEPSADTCSAPDVPAEHKLRRLIQLPSS